MAFIKGTFNENISLVHIPPGKKYLGSQQFYPQAAQKGEVCWYYAYNLQRPRIGKELEEKIRAKLHTNPKKEAAEKLLKTRQIEQAISHYKKNIEKRGWIISILIQVLGNHGERCSIQKAYQLFLAIQEGKLKKLPYNLSRAVQYIDEKRIVPRKQILEQITQLLEQYLSQKEHTTLDNYAKALRDEDIVVHSELLFKQLGIEDEIEQHTWKIVRDILKKTLGPPLDLIVSSLPNEELKVHYNKLPNSVKSLLMSSLVLQECAKLYRMSVVNWSPSPNGFLSLMHLIRNHGAITVGVDAIGMGYYATAPQLEGSLSNYKVYSWPSNAKKRDNIANEGHAVTLVGAQRIKNENGEMKETVLFIDPNDESTPNQARKIYRVPYEQLVENTIKNIPLYCVNDNFNQEINACYRNWNEYNQILEKIQNECKRLIAYTSNGGNIFVRLGLIKASDNKIHAFKSLQKLISNKPDGYLEQSDFHEKLHSWKKTTGCDLKYQRNKLHTFFSPKHRTRSETIVDEVFNVLMCQ